MKVNFDGHILDATAVKISSNDRGFQYADGIFETIILKDAKIQYLPYHLQRLKKGLHALKLANSSTKEPIEWEEKILELAKINRMSDSRIKIFVWRQQGGLYTPTGTDFHYLITSREYHPAKPQALKNVGICKSLFLSPSPFSSCKTMNALSYVMAGIEKRENEWEEIILCDRRGHLSEAGSANLFWKKGNEFFTPSLNTGCIAGVRRAALIEELEEQGYTVNRGEYSLLHLEKASHLWKTNVTGMVPIAQLEHLLFEETLPEEVAILQNHYNQVK
ncbi:aminotransferase class IV [Persicobacter psychrovividus]|uniref:branched-chain-amino-acid transaminase n=1 Tax=Persicobacter psychrovividus TaxID=387638 RepID=A0ABM7VEC6_9BACT|nr:aminodeoxychorismate lyase [Persicobacter psychrovividus]